KYDTIGQMERIGLGELWRDSCAIVVELGAISRAREQKRHVSAGNFRAIAPPPQGFLPKMPSRSPAKRFACPPESTYVFNGQPNGPFWMVAPTLHGRSKTPHGALSNIRGVSPTCVDA